MDGVQTRAEGGVAVILTRGASVEVVVILGDISQDAEAVGDLKGHHVFCIQQGRNSQLLLRNPEGLEITNTHILSYQIRQTSKNMTHVMREQQIRDPLKFRNF